MSLAFSMGENVRQELCAHVHLQVQIWGMTASGEPFLQVAQAVDVGPLRALIVGLEHEVHAGEVLGMEYRGRRARFCTVWAGQPNTPEAGTIQVRLLDLAQDFWDMDFSQVGEPYRFERRSAPRYACRGSISIYREDAFGSISAAVTDISLSGCYVELMATFPPGSKISALMNVESISVRFTAEVRTSHPGVGMGVKFGEMSAADHVALENLIAKLAAIPRSPGT